MISIADLCEDPLLLAGKKVTLGIRPEQISAFSSSKPGNKPVYKLNCPVLISEPTGPDTHIFVHINDQTTCRIHPDKAARPGETMQLVFDISKAVLFDPTTEKRIY